MNVKRLFIKVNRLHKRWLILLPVALILLFSALFLLFTARENLPFPTNRAALVMRQIGHQLLLQSGDSSSRVLPVKNSVAGLYELKFEREFSFLPDSLLRIVKHEIAASDILTPYEVSVKACMSDDVVYGFEIIPQAPGNKSAYKEIVPCLGRTQPKACYLIQIRFQQVQPQKSSVLLPWILIFGAFLCLILSWWRVGRNKIQNTLGMQQQIINLGGFSYTPERQILVYQEQVISLSDKENQLLSLLASRLADLVTREELLKKVWEDEGVITGRSLDVFISKLRKKLQADPNVRLNNVHGRGYKLEIHL